VEKCRYCGKLVGLIEICGDDRTLTSRKVIRVEERFEVKFIG
jgi:hypothetical protein